MRIELCGILREPRTLAAALGAVWRGKSVEIKGISTDSREVRTGDLFVALRGARTDGAAHIPEALSKGAAGVLVPMGGALHCGDLAVLEADDPGAALLRGATFRRRHSKAFLIAVSGSTGKTTVKEAITTLLGGAGKVRCSEGNYNSSIGFPLSLLSFEEAPFWVVELGINHPGEMEPMARAANPDLAVLTNVGTAHIGQFGDFSSLLAEKAKLAVNLRDRGRALVPIELPAGAFPCAPERLLRMGDDKNADFYMENISMDENGVRGDLILYDRVITNLKWCVPGRIGLSTLQTVASAGVLAGLSDEELRRGLLIAGERTPRLKCFSVGERLLIDDSYNASPESVVGAMEVLRYRAAGRPRVAVLGDMLELGVYASSLHAAVGEAVARSGILMLFTYGRRALHFAEGAKRGGMPAGAILSFDEGETVALVDALARIAPRNAAILFKASKKMELGKIVQEMRR